MRPPDAYATLHAAVVAGELSPGERLVEEAIEILEACAALESLAAGYAAVRRTEEQARELKALVKDMERLLAAGELLAMSERNATLQRRILEIAGHEVARDICARLHSQVVRFQFRTVLAPGRSQKSLAEHKAIVKAIASGDRAGGRARDARAPHERRRRAGERGRSRPPGLSHGTLPVGVPSCRRWRSTSSPWPSPSAAGSCS